MANPFASFMQFLSFGDEYDDIDDEYEYGDDAYEQKRLARICEKEEARERKAQEKLERKERRMAATSSTYEEPAEAPVKERPSRSYSNDKIVPLSSGRGFEVSVLRPNNIVDAQDACDMLLGGNAVIVNLEGNEIDRAQGIMDFISGCIYAIKGNMHQISKYNFIFSPANIDISGDYLDIAAEEGITVPTLDEEF